MDASTSTLTAEQAKAGAPVEITDGAFRRVAAITAAEPAPSALRIAVEGGGCSGFSYKYEIVPAKAAADDLVFERLGATVLIDMMSIVYMKNARIDFVDDLMGQAFRITNPNAVASCGCGTSFSV